MTKLIYVPGWCKQVWLNRPSICTGDEAKNQDADGSFIEADEICPIQNRERSHIATAAVSSDNSILVYFPHDKAYYFGDPDRELHFVNIQGGQEIMKVRDAISVILGLGLAEGRYGGREQGSLLEAIENLCLKKEDALFLKNNEMKVVMVVTRVNTEEDWA